MRKTLAIAGMVALIATPVFADNTDTDEVTVTGAVIAALELAVVNSLTMPDLVLPTTTAGETDTTATTEVTLTCDAAGAPGDELVTYAGGGNPYADGDTGNNLVIEAGANATANLGNRTGTCAELTVTGQADYNFALGLGNIDVTTAGITMDNLACTDENSVALVDTNTATLTGTDLTIFCGARLTAAAAASAGAIAGTYDVTVTYD